MAPTLAAPPTIADRSLIRAAQKRGVRLSIDQLRTWRRLGLMPSPQRRHLGRGHGTVSEYPPGALDAACAVAGLPWRIRRHPDQAALALFARRQPIAEPLLRDAWRRWLDQLSTEAAPRTDEPDALAVVERLLSPAFVMIERSKLGRSMLRDLHTQEEKKLPPDRETAGALLFSALTVLLQLLLGISLPINHDKTALTEAQAALNLTTAPDPKILTLSGMAETVSATSLFELARARDDMQDALRCLTDFAAANRHLSAARPLALLADIPPTSGESAEMVTLGVPIMLRLRSLHPDDYTTIIEAVHSNGQRFAAMRSLNASLPSGLRLPLTPDRIARMSPVQLGHFRTAYQRWTERNPALAAQFP